jgi:hypothetical protein
VVVSLFALLLSPAVKDPSLGSHREAHEVLGARVLVPTGDEAIERKSPKLAIGQTYMPRQRPRMEPIPVAVASAIAFLMFLWAGFAGRPFSEKPSGLFAFQSLSPRGPPRLQAV